MLNRMCVLALALLAAVPAAAEEKSWSLWTYYGGAFDFFNTGMYAGKGIDRKPTSFSVVEWQKGGTYVLGVGIVPGFGTGLEGDLRAGRRFKAEGGLDYDLSIAYYGYKVDRDSWDHSLNLRAIVSKTYRAGGSSLTPYLWLDETLPLQSPHQHYFGGRLGAKFAHTFSAVPWTPGLWVDLSGWRYFSAPTTGKSIFITDLGFSVKPNPGPADFTVGVTYRRTDGAVDYPSIGDVHRSHFGGIVSFKF